MANYILLQSITLGAAAASVTFTNLPTSGYTDLKVTMSARGSASQEAGDFLLSLNGSTSNFTMRRLFTFQSTVYGDTGGGSFNYLGQYPGAVQTANTFGIAEFTIPNYRATKPTPINATSQDETNSTSALTYIGSNIWNDSSAISNFTISGNAGNFVAGSTFNVYGIAATGTTPTNPKAIGGDIVVNDGTYWYHAFLSSGVFTPSQTLSCDYLVVAGGGAGGYDCGGGGAAGGYLTSTAFSVSTSAAVTVGAGGAYTANRGSSGSNSVFSTITATGGGGGGSRVSTFGAGANGGSGGGGGGDNSGAGGSASPSGQGNAGGRGLAATTPGGGGGGSGSAGSNTTGESAPGNGGNGLNTLSAWASATSTGVSGYYAGGGGGGYNAGNNGGSGGGGYGGGASSVNNGRAAIAGVANSGSGGGGGSNGAAASILGGNGGSGIVIVRYAV
jgi:hypothetical protein